MDHLLELFHSEYDDNLLDVNLHMLKALLVVSHPSKSYTVYTVLFRKDGGANFAVINCMSHFSMFVPTKSTVKFSNGNTGCTQGIGFIICRLPTFSIIYTVVPFCYFPVHPPNTISSGALKFYVGFQKVASEILNIFTLLNLNVVLVDHPTRLKIISTMFNFFLNSTLK